MRTEEISIKKEKERALSYYTAKQLIKYNPDSKLIKSYKNTCYCATKKRKVKNRKTGEVEIKTKYCKNRWCFICNNIRMAVNISHYLPQLEEMENPYFVTLTLPTCTAEELPERIKYFEATWRKIYNRSHEKRVKEINEKDIRLNGVRSMECTLRPDGMYHYHMHLIIEGRINAEWLVQKWLKINKKANGEAQDFREIDKGVIL